MFGLYSSHVKQDISNPIPQRSNASSLLITPMQTLLHLIMISLTEGLLLTVRLAFVDRVSDSAGTKVQPRTVEYHWDMTIYAAVHLYIQFMYVIA